MTTLTKIQSADEDGEMWLKAQENSSKRTLSQDEFVELWY